MVGVDSLENYYKTNSDLIHTRFFTLQELDNMLPFERDIYISLHNKYIEEKEEEKRNSTNSLSNLLR